MIYIKPWFYDTFKCTNSKCKDNCCIGWEIDVDNTTLCKYRTLNNSFGDEIQSQLSQSEDGSVCFRLDSRERCPFLNEDNLCRIIINCGEEYLCEICKEHPRFYEWFAGVTECGLGLSCEEVCRILLTDESEFSLEEENDGKETGVNTKEEIVESDTYIFISAFRDVLFDTLNDKSKTLDEKLVKILSLTESFTGEKCKITNLKKLVDTYSQTEPIDEEWTRYIADVKIRAEQIENTEFDEEIFNRNYSKILCYILYRHLIKSVFDGLIAQRVCFCVDALRFIMLCDRKTFADKGKVTDEEQIDNIKRWSKQIEYSEENTEFLTESYL